MKVEGKVAVVTGAGSGIGRALAHRLAAAGAAVVAADLREEAAADTVAGIEQRFPGRAVAAGGDAADRAAIDALIAVAGSSFGPVDLYLANAGLVAGEELAEEADWTRALEVNLMAHVRAAQALLPGWLERGEGHFVATASAAGLLTQIGLAPYSVSKHAAVGFAEWLAVTYGGRGVGVSCLCPMGVATPMLERDLGGAGGAGLGGRVIAAAGPVLSAEEVAEAALAGVEAERFLILPHPEVLDFYRGKGADYDGWIRGMQRLRARAGGG